MLLFHIAVGFHYTAFSRIAKEAVSRRRFACEPYSGNCRINRIQTFPYSCSVHPIFSEKSGFFLPPLAFCAALQLPSRDHAIQKKINQNLHCTIKPTIFSVTALVDIRQQKKHRNKLFQCFYLAESQGFEPWRRSSRLHDFQSCAFDHSANSPNIELFSQRTRNIIPDKSASVKCFFTFISFFISPPRSEKKPCVLQRRAFDNHFWN